MKLHQLKPAKGAKKIRKRVGRGPGSGLGTYSGRGMKGQKSRSGAGFYPGFEGGKTPLVKLLPKVRGFKSNKPIVYEVTVATLDAKFKDGDIIDKIKLKQARVIKSLKEKVKIISTGSTKKKLTVVVDKATKNAIKSIETAGGKVKLILAKKKNLKKNAENKKN